MQLRVGLLGLTEEDSVVLFLLLLLLLCLALTRMGKSGMAAVFAWFGFCAGVACCGFARGWGSLLLGCMMGFRVLG